MFECFTAILSTMQPLSSQPYTVVHHYNWLPSLTHVTSYSSAINAANHHRLKSTQAEWGTNLGTGCIVAYSLRFRPRVCQATLSRHFNAFFCPIQSYNNISDKNVITVYFIFITHDEIQGRQNIHGYHWMKTGLLCIVWWTGIHH